MDLSYYVFGLAIVVLIVFAIVWTQFKNPNVKDIYSPIRYEEIPPDTIVEVPSIITPEAEPEIEEPIIPAIPAKVRHPIRPSKYNEIVPLYSKKRRSRGENACARALEELFGVPFPSERPTWAMGKKGRPLEFDCINHDLKLACEYHGEQHYEPGHFNMDQDGFQDQNERDRMKIEYAKDNGYYLITVPYTVPLEQIKDYIISYLPGNRKKRLDQDLTF